LSVDTEVELITGKYLDVYEPDPAAISLDAVAHGLANTCRFTGQSIRFYSVAEHAVLVARRLQELGYSADVVMEGLHHDDAEAFLGDVTRPLKRRLEDYREIEGRMSAAVSRALGVPIPDPMSSDVKAADTWALACEAHNLLPSKGRTWFCDGEYTEGDAGAEGFSFGLPPAEARDLWLRAHCALRDGWRIPAPTPQHRNSERFHAILRELGELHDKKQQDYGREGDPFANVRGSSEWGVPDWVGAMVRASDKVRRLQTFARRGTLANEGVKDAFMDLAVYSVIALVLFEEGEAAES